MNSRTASFTLACLIAAGAGSSRAAGPVTSVQLTGVAQIHEKTFALLEIVPRPDRPTTFVRAVLGKGERRDQVKVCEIDARTGRVLLAIGADGSSVEEKLFVVDDSPVEESGRTLHFKSADLEQVIEVYQILSGRTVLRANNLVGARLDIKTTKLATEEALRRLEEVLLAKGVVLQPIGSKFTFAVRGKDVNRLSFIPEPPTPAIDAGDGSEKFPAGMIKFIGADVLQVLEIYQELSKRTILRPQDIRGRFTLRTQTEMTLNEAVWLLDAALALGDIAMVPHSDKFVFALPGIENPQVPGFTPNPVPVSVQSKEPLPAGFLKFQDADTDQVLSTYASLIGRQALSPAPTMPAAKLSIVSRTPLTTVEAVFALDAVAALNHLKFDLSGDRQVQMSPVAPARRDARRSAQQPN